MAPLRIVFHKLSDERHRLEIVRDGGARETVECETRSYLQHDLLHYAVESEAQLAGGFWGRLREGRTLEEMNDRSGRSMTAEVSELMLIERIVGVLSSAVKGRTAEDLAAGLSRYAAASGEPLPGWLTVSFIAAVQERMRQLGGRWKATRCGEALELEFGP